MGLNQGDIILANLNSTKEHEKRPVMIVSSDAYYRHTGLLVVTPISNTNNDFPMHISLPYGMKTTGKVLTQHIRTIDPKEREILFLEKMPKDVLGQVLDVINLVF